MGGSGGSWGPIHGRPIYLPGDPWKRGQRVIRKRELDGE